MSAFRLARRERPRPANAALQSLERACHSLRTAPCLGRPGKLCIPSYHLDGVLVRKLISQRFTLTDNETEQLIQLAEQEAEQAIDYHCFTSLINTHFSAEEKVDIVEHLWQIAYADGQINKYEDHLVRKISELIYVPHSAFIAAKHRAEANDQ